MRCCSRRRRRGCPAPLAFGASCRRRRGPSPVTSERGIFQLVISAASTPGPRRQPGGVLAPPTRAAPRTPRPRLQAAPRPARAEFAKSRNCGRWVRADPRVLTGLRGHCLPLKPGTGLVSNLITGRIRAQGLRGRAAAAARRDGARRAARGAQSGRGAQRERGPRRGEPCLCFSVNRHVSFTG